MSKEEVIQNICINQDKNKEVVESVIDNYFNIIAEKINSTDNRDIKLDYFGKLKFNTKKFKEHKLRHENIHKE